MGPLIVHLARWLAWQIAEPAAPLVEQPASITVFSSRRRSAPGR